MHRSGPGRWLWVALCCGAAFGVLTMPIAAGRNWPGEWQVVQWALSSRSAFWTGVMQAVTFAGSSVVGLGLSAGLSAVLWLRVRRLTRLVALPLVAMLGSAPLNFGLRAACGRLRPGVTYIPHRLPEIAHPFQCWSYPSGHAMTAAICYGLLAYLIGRANPRLRWWAVGAWIAWLVLVSWSRVYLGVHWPTDVLGGWLIGAAWLALCIAWLGGTDRAF